MLLDMLATISNKWEEVGMRRGGLSELKSQLFEVGGQSVYLLLKLSNVDLEV